MKKDDITRRNFLVKLSAATGLSVGAGAFLSACGGGKSDQAPATEAPEIEAPAVAASCDDVSGLSDADVNLRTTLQYVDESPDTEKTCKNCALFVIPEGESPCGTCTLLKGPIAAGGYCTSWVPVPA